MEKNMSQNIKTIVNNKDYLTKMFTIPETERTADKLKEFCSKNDINLTLSDEDATLLEAVLSGLQEEVTKAQSNGTLTSMKDDEFADAVGGVVMHMHYISQKSADAYKSIIEAENKAKRKLASTITSCILVTLGGIGATCYALIRSKQKN